MIAAPRIGILGGTFDPPHRGHLFVASEMLARLSLDTVVLMPCHIHAENKQPAASPRQRLAMLQRMLGDHPRLVVDGRELQRQGRSYTVDSLTAIRRERGDQAVLCFILGSDAFTGLYRWHRWQSLLDLANFVVVERAGELPLQQLASPTLRPLLDAAVDSIETPAGAVMTVALPPCAVSSTALRQALQLPPSSPPSQLAAAENILQNDLSDAVRAYIRTHRLYPSPLESC